MMQCICAAALEKDGRCRRTGCANSLETAHQREVTAREAENAKLIEQEKEAHKILSRADAVHRKLSELHEADEVRIPEKTIKYRALIIALLEARR